jgi:hypothetical protein
VFSYANFNTFALFYILFREQSYSNLGFSYDKGEIPPGFGDYKCYFTGKYNNWGMKDVEVYGRKDFVSQNKWSLLSHFLFLMEVSR